jgi:hypothetical protein
MATAGTPSLGPELSTEVLQGAWRLLEAGDTRCLSQVESPGFQTLLRRAREASRDAGGGVPALASLEDLAQLLALWRPGGRRERGGLPGGPVSVGSVHSTSIRLSPASSIRHLALCCSPLYRHLSREQR